MSLSYTKHNDTGIKFADINISEFKSTLDAIIKNKCEYVVVNSNEKKKWDTRDIELLINECNFIKGVWIVDDIFDFSKIDKLANLEFLSINYTKESKGIINLSKIEKLKYLYFDFHKNILGIESLTSLVQLHCSKWQYINLDLITPNKNLEILRLDSAKRLETLDAIENFSQLKRLFIYSAPKLKSIDRLKFLSHNLKTVSLELCPEIEDYKCLDFLIALETVYIERSAPIHSVQFIASLNNLKYAYIGVEIKDRNISILKDKGIEYKNFASYKN